MKTALPQDISDFAAVAAKRLARLGGPPAALRAETDDGIRDAARTALNEVGAFELDVRSASDDLLAAAVLCQAAGATALPYPLVEELLAIDGARLALVNPEAPRIDHGDLPGDWIAADLDGTRYHPQPASRTNAKLGPFLVPASLSAPDGTVPAADVNLHLVLGSWRILGAMQQSLQIVTEHVRARIQFGKPLADFQAVRFAVADAAVAVRGLHELAKYTICRPESLPVQVRSADALMLRFKAADTARQVLRTSHQLLGALGFCDESDVSVLDRHTQPLIRLPLGAEALGAAPDTRRPRRLPGDTVQWAGIGMSTEPIASGVTPNPLDEGIPFGTKLQELAEQRRDETAVTIVALDGTAQSLTFGELDARANQWGRALAASGAETGSLVALAIPNSQHLVLATLGCWKIGAVPIPMHWDLPEWERNRVRAVIDPAVVVDEKSRWELDARAAGESDSPLPTAVSPTANGICSSGSTGVPKVILNLAPSLWTPQHGEPFLSNWTPVAQPQTIMVPAPMYHTNGFATFLFLLAGDHLVMLEKFDAALVLDVIERFRITNFTATPTMLARIAARPDVRQRDLSSIVFILQGAAVMPPSLMHTWFELLSPEQIVTAYGMTENLGLTALRGDEWLAHPGQRRPRFPGHRDPDSGCRETTAGPR